MVNAHHGTLRKLDCDFKVSIYNFLDEQKIEETMNESLGIISNSEQ
jgi:hypothetical protein